jgi:hypothetical protein
MLVTRCRGSCCDHRLAPAVSLRVSDLGSERAGQGEARLTGGALGSAGQSAVHRQLVSTSQFVRLSQARAHLCTCQVFVH